MTARLQKCCKTAGRGHLNRREKAVLKKAKAFIAKEELACAERIKNYMRPLVLQAFKHGMKECEHLKSVDFEGTYVDIFTATNEGYRQHDQATLPRDLYLLEDLCNLLDGRYPLEPLFRDEVKP